MTPTITVVWKLSKSHILNYMFIKVKILHDRINGNHQFFLNQEHNKNFHRSKFA